MNEIIMTNSKSLKPTISLNGLRRIVENLYDLEIEIMNELNGYDDRNFHVIAKTSRNPHISTPIPQGYVLKILNSEDSKNISLADGQTQLLLHLKLQGYSAPVPVKNIHGAYFTQENGCANKEGNVNIVRLLEFQPGTILKQAPASLNLYRQVGICLAKLDDALKSFHHPVFDSHTSIWYVKSVPTITNYVSFVSDPERRALVTEVFDAFIRKIQPVIPEMEQGMIHGDFNEQNILVSSSHDSDWRISAVLDFGDANYSCYLFEIGAAIAYVMLEAKRNTMDPIQSGGETLRGYLSVKPLALFELELLKVAVCSRLCQSLVLGLYSQSLQPENAYVSDTQEFGWTILASLWSTPDEILDAKWCFNELSKTKCSSK